MATTTGCPGQCAGGSTSQFGGSRIMRIGLSLKRKNDTMMTIQEIEKKLETVDKFEYYSTADNKTYVVEKTPKGFSMTKKESIQ